MSPKINKAVIGLSFVGLFIFIPVFLYLLTRNSENKPSASGPQKQITSSGPSPTELPFRELTIPYLREKTYTSRLGTMEQAYEGSGYTAYLTSYTSDGLKINGLLTKPNGKQPNEGWPAIVFIHGYIPPKQYQTLERYVDYVDYLARNGFAVFKIDLRGHGNSEGKAGGGYFGADYVTDTLNAYAALQSADFINPNAVGLWGHSMAGNTVLRSMAVRPDIPAAVIWAGAVYSYSDMVKYGIHDASYSVRPSGNPQNNTRRRLFEKVGSPSAQSVYWRQMAPTYYLNDLKGAIEINHAEDDDTVNIGYSRDLNALLDKTSIPHEFYEYPNGGHNISDSSFTIAMERTVGFFKKYLTK